MANDTELCPEADAIANCAGVASMGQIGNEVSFTVLYVVWMHSHKITKKEHVIFVFGLKFPLKLLLERKFISWFFCKNFFVPVAWMFYGSTIYRLCFLNLILLFQPIDPETRFSSSQPVYQKCRYSQLLFFRQFGGVVNLSFLRSFVIYIASDIFDWW